jgi:tetratricopeptide (TPR) repeat protein
MSLRIPPLLTAAKMSSALTDGKTPISNISTIELPLSPINPPANNFASTAEKTVKTGTRLIQKRDNADPLLQKTKPPKKPKSRLMKPVENGDDLFEARQYAEALQVYEKLLLLYSHNQNALYKKAVCQLNLGQIQASGNCFSDYLQIYSNDAKAWARKGGILIQQHQYPQALYHLKKSIELDPSDIFLEFNVLGACYHSFREVVTSAPYHLRHPDSSIAVEDVHLLKGIFFAAHQEYRSALEELTQAAQIPSNIFARRILNIVNRRANHQRDRSAEKKTLLSTGSLPISSLVDLSSSNSLGKE